MLNQIIPSPDELPQLPPSRITEDQVKRAIIPFLKSFYQHRYEPLPGSTETSFDNVGSGGLVADVLMRFRKQDDSLFLCACEATARGKEDEVRFQLNRLYFFWDCLAFSAVFTTVCYILFYLGARRWLVGLAGPGNLGLFIGLALIGFLLWYFTMPGWRKYRYIMAVEQFKQYFADDQWIALAADVFPNPADPYLVELRRQCVYQGFGLALVSEDGTVRPLINPTRLDFYGKDRKMAEWVTNTALYQRMSEGMAAAAKLRPSAPKLNDALLNKVLRPVQENVWTPLKDWFQLVFGKPIQHTYGRFMQGQTIQKAIILLALIVLIPLMGRVLVPDEKSAAQLDRYSPLNDGYNPEDYGGANYESGPIPYGAAEKAGGIPKQYYEPIKPPRPKLPPEEVKTLAGKKPAEEEVPTINLSGDDSDTIQTINLSGDDEEDTQAAKPAAGAAKKSAAPAKTDRCAAWHDKKGWMVQDNVFSTPSMADKRVADLRKKNITASVVWLGCLTPGKDGYLVWLGSVHKTENSARQSAVKLESLLKQKQVLAGPLIVRKLQ